MTIDRAIEILTPDRRPDYSPGEYEEALEMARGALKKLRRMECIVHMQRYIQADDFRYQMLCEVLDDGQ